MSDAATTPPIVGIDLGTTYSVVAHLDDHGRPVSLRSGEGDLTTPSVVFFDANGVFVGKEALLAAEHEPERVARFAKRDIGEKTFAKSIRGEQLPPEVVQALVLRKLKADAERELGPIEKAVITVPAYFNEPRRKATQDAARLAGLELLDIVNEPTAAAITFGIQQGFLNDRGESVKKETVLVYDLGGGTFDCTLMEIDGRRYDCLGTLGEVRLGGIDWDRRLVDHLAEQFEAVYEEDPRTTDAGYEVLLHRAVEAKHGLSSRAEVPLRIVVDGKGGAFTVSRETFESLTSDLVERTLGCVRRLLESTGRKWRDLTQLVLVGGSTRMPMIHEALRAESRLTVDRSLSPDEAVAHGAAVYAGLLAREADGERTIRVANVNSHDLGVLAVASEAHRSIRQVVVPRNTPLPVTKSWSSKTAKFDQRSVRIEVVEGADEHGEGMTRIGRCVVRDLPPELPAGTPVDVVFTYERNGRLSVEGVLPTVKRHGSLEIERAAGLGEDEIAYWTGRIEEGMTDAAVPARVDSAPAERSTALPHEGVEPARVEAAAKPIPESTAESAVVTIVATPVGESSVPEVRPVRKLKKLTRKDAVSQEAPPSPGPAPNPEPEAPKPPPPRKRRRPRPKPSPSSDPTPSDTAEPSETPEAVPSPPKKDWRSRAKKLSGE